jgi:stage IV sporulation protein B
MRKKSGERACRTKIISVLLVAATFLCFLCSGFTVSAKENGGSEEKVILGGDVFGTRISTKGVLVVGLTSIVSGKAERSPARDAGICSKDIIISVNGVEVKDAGDLISKIEKSEGKTLEISLVRDGKTVKVDLTPLPSDSDGIYRAGLWIRDSLAGIGTVTFVIPKTGEFAGLGHGICDPDTGVLMPVGKGSVFGVRLGDIKKGSAGEPGELRGRLAEVKIGSIVSNNVSGICGVLSEIPSEGKLYAVASKDDVKAGKVSVICTVDSSGAHEYSAEIEKICDADGEIKNFIIKITDEKLLGLTGGIVQGMSGSPIIQNGKLVGAITHVLIDDPTRGYGIFAQNMLEQIK